MIQLEYGRVVVRAYLCYNEDTIDCEIRISYIAKVLSLLFVIRFSCVIGIIAIFFTCFLATVKVDR